MTDVLSREYAENMDRADSLASFKSRFYIAEGAVYMDGNSLGLLSRDAEASLLKTLEQWKTLGIDGWLKADPPWFYLGEELGKRSAALVGAKPEEVIVAGTTTVNLHALVATFYQPAEGRRKIVAGELDFPSDIYALQSQILLRGGEPDRDLVKVASRDGRIIEEDDIIAELDGSVALVLLPSVLYRSGQLFDIQRVTAAAHKYGIPVGWDCCHSAGIIPHHFDEWDVDFAFWCNYKYLNAGPGGIASLYVNEEHFDKQPAMPGWWGYQKDRQFDMLHEFEGADGAGAWQISTITVLSAAPLVGSLQIMEEAGIERVRAKSLALTDYLVTLIEKSGLTVDEYGYEIGTPREHDRRGGHIAVEHEHAAAIARSLKSRGVVPDFRPPNVIRLAPVPLYTSFVDVWQTVQHLREIIETGEFRHVSAEREVVA
ncbi:kynureninase [soil metagenome]